MSSYLITGGCGFIGSHLGDALCAAGHRVRVLDDLSTGSLANLNPAAEMLHGSILDAALMRRAVTGMDGCFHLAAIASVERGVRDWPGTHAVNLSGTITLFDAVRALPHPVPVVYASSAAVYGDCDTLPIAESVPCRPLSAYGADKLGCEQHARIGGHVFGIPSAGLRFFNVYGSRQDPRSPYSGVISIFADRLSRGERVTILGDGEQTRDFVHVRDVVRALLAAMCAAGAAAPVWNVCSGQPTSVRRLAELIGELSGHNLASMHAPGRRGEIRHSVGDPTRARAALALPAPISLRDGLAETLAWMSPAAAPTPHAPQEPEQAPLRA